MNDRTRANLAIRRPLWLGALLRVLLFAGGKEVYAGRARCRDHRCRRTAGCHRRLAGVRGQHVTPA